MVDSLVSLAVNVMNFALKNPKVVQAAASRFQSGWQAWKDTRQVLEGRVNLDSQHRAIEKAGQLCIRKDEDEQRQVASFVAALYLQHGAAIVRAAQVGGSLRKRFGVSLFPHIAEHEIRFALDVDPELEAFVNSLIREGQAVPAPLPPVQGTFGLGSTGSAVALPANAGMAFRAFLKGL